MKSACVLGNGPSLSSERIPPDAIPIGVNRSHVSIWSPFLCTTDGRAAQQWFLEPLRHEPVLYVTAFVDPVDSTRVLSLDPPPWASGSGRFAAWFAACCLEVQRIFLLGFDGGRGHFDRSDDYNREKMEARLTVLVETLNEITFHRWRGGDYREL